jgi:hypothetical protein
MADPLRMKLLHWGAVGGRQSPWLSLNGRDRIADFGDTESPLAGSTSSERNNKILSNSALDRDRDTVEACRLVLGMRCRPGYKNVYLVERFDEGSKSRSNRPPGPSAGIYSTIAPVSVGALRDNGVERGLPASSA